MKFFLFSKAALNTIDKNQQAEGGYRRGKEKRRAMGLILVKQIDMAKE